MNDFHTKSREQRGEGGAHHGDDREQRGEGGERCEGRERHGEGRERRGFGRHPRGGGFGGPRGRCHLGGETAREGLRTGGETAREGRRHGGGATREAVRGLRAALIAVARSGDDDKRAEAAKVLAEASTRLRSLITEGTQA